MSNRIPSMRQVINSSQTNLFNTYTSGSGVGANSISNRRAKIVRASLNKGTMDNPKTGKCNGFCVNGSLPHPSGNLTHSLTSSAGNPFVYTNLYSTFISFTANASISTFEQWDDGVSPVGTSGLQKLLYYLNVSGGPISNFYTSISGITQIIDGNGTNIPEMMAQNQVQGPEWFNSLGGYIKTLIQDLTNTIDSGIQGNVKLNGPAIYELSQPCIDSVGSLSETINVSPFLGQFSTINPNITEDYSSLNPDAIRALWLTLTADTSLYQDTANDTYFNLGQGANGQASTGTFPTNVAVMVNDLNTDLPLISSTNNLTLFIILRLGPDNGLCPNNDYKISIFHPPPIPGENGTPG